MIVTDTNEGVKNRITINNQVYEIVLSLYNTQGIFFPINVAGFRSLVIEQNTHEWFAKGYIVLINGENAIERRPSADVGADQNYQFRNDGRDLLLVNIKPVLTDTTTPQDALAPEFWELNYTFSIYDTEDISTGDSTSNKDLKLFFWEVEQQILFETNANWGTAMAFSLVPDKPTIPIAHLTDDERRVPTGTAIQSLLQTVLDPFIPQKFVDDWDIGSSKINYTSPSNNNSIDDLDYLLIRHSSSKQYGLIDGDPSLLTRDRYSKKWALVSLSTFFSGAVSNNAAGPLQFEQFYIDSRTTSNSIIPSLKKTPQDSTGNRNINLGLLGTISNFQFVDMSPLDNCLAIVSVPCYSNNIKTKQFNLDFEDNTIESIKKYIQNNYVNRMKHSDQPVALLTLNRNKTESGAFKNTYSYGATKVDRYSDSRNPVIKSAMFLNQCLNFNTLGSTFRRHNCFIGIDRKNSTIENTFDDKLLGQWFVFKIRHEFTQDSYTNNITAVKIHACSNPKISDDVN